ncbi:hypothetical protein OsI_32586 [Oryza sativa Indica Group]|uniref:Uncharacterized protein n=1 Tax=Oryza sativa subsp. indica TaxID=39946 RepID=B8BFH5_ORYSI|nr:hypothetical protein OsI_32586 [Oryza sativa Indica Group]
MELQCSPGTTEAQTGTVKPAVASPVLGEVGSEVEDEGDLLVVVVAYRVVVMQLDGDVAADEEVAAILPVPLACPTSSLDGGPPPRLLLDGGPLTPSPKIRKRGPLAPSIASFAWWSSLWLGLAASAAIGGDEAAGFSAATSIFQGLGDVIDGGRRWMCGGVGEGGG